MDTIRLRNIRHLCKTTVSNRSTNTRFRMYIRIFNKTLKDRENINEVFSFKTKYIHNC